MHIFSGTFLSTCLLSCVIPVFLLCLTRTGYLMQFCCGMQTHAALQGTRAGDGEAGLRQVFLGVSRDFNYAETAVLFAALQISADVLIF